MTSTMQDWTWSQAVHDTLVGWAWLNDDDLDLIAGRRRRAARKPRHDDAHVAPPRAARRWPAGADVTPSRATTATRGAQHRTP